MSKKAKFKQTLFLFFLICQNLANGQVLNKIDSVGDIGIGTTTPEAVVHASGGTAMTAGWNRTMLLQGSYPVHAFNSANTKWAGIGYDFSSGMQFWVNAGSNDIPAGYNAITILNNGNIGFGKNSPTAKLDINGSLKASGTISSSYTHEVFVATNGGPNPVAARYGNTGNDVYFGTEGATGGGYFTGSMPYATVIYSTNSIQNIIGGVAYTTLLANGKLGIGTTTPDEKLSVNGNIRAKKLIVSQSGWSDYVFNDDYKLRSVTSLAAFIKKNRHLPEIPTSKEVEEKGVSVGDHQALLLKKIEELTLYMIKQQKQIDALSKRNLGFERQIGALKKKLRS